MKAIHTPSLAVSIPSLRTALRRIALAGVCLVLAACGGNTDAPPPPETIPAILTQPADQSVVVGSAATYNVSAVGAAPLSYQWAGSPDGVTFTDIVGATSASYSTGATTLAQTGTRYRVVVSNSLGSATSSAAHLTVTPAVVAPAITVQPADQSVTAPATATFNVTATGTAPSYQWQLSTDAGTTFNPVAGGPNAPSLAIANTTTAQSGQRFRVVVSNSAGSVTSSAALLTVLATPTAPAFTTQPSAQTIAAGQAASFTVAATGTPAPTIQWRINGANLVDGALASGVCSGATVAGATSVTLTLTAVPIGCSGAVFSAVASNGVNPDATSNGAALTVNPAAVAPSITLQPADASVLAPATATFTAAASGTPSPTVQWQQSIDAGVTWTNINGATSASFTTPATVLADNGKRFRAVFTNASGSVNSNAAVLTVTAGSAATMSLLAGDVGGFGNLDGTGSAARLGAPDGAAVDASGNVFIADTGNQTIRKITPAGVVTTFAGLPSTIGSADGTGSAARFFNPASIAIDAAGTFYVAELGNSTIRKITPAGVVSTLAGLAGSVGSTDGAGAAARFRNPTGIAVDTAGNVYVADRSNHTIRKITPAGVVSTLAGLAGTSGSADGTGSAARFFKPSGVAVDTAGNVYVADEDNQTIRKITPAGVVSTLAGTALSAGFADGTGPAARFADPWGVAVDATGNVYITDQAPTVRKITPAGVVTTLAGLGGSFGSIDGTGSAARFYLPTGIALDAANNLYVTDAQNSNVRKVTPAGAVSTLAGLAANYGSADGTGSAAQFSGETGVAVDAAGNLYIADNGNNTIRKVTPAGVVSTFAGSGFTGSADGTGGAAQFFNPNSVAVDAAGNVYVADTVNQTIRKITPAGVVTTLAGTAGSAGSADGTGAAAQFISPSGVAVDAAGNVYVADLGNSTIRKITPAGVVTTLAGSAGSTGGADGTGAAAQFVNPNGVAVDAAGNVYVADTGNHTIRKITPAGVVNTLAGTAGVFGSADGSGSAARFNTPFGVAVDATGNVYVADSLNATIREITPAGVVSTVAGVVDEAGIRLGANGRLAFPQGVAVIGPKRLAVVSGNASAVVIVDLP